MKISTPYSDNALLTKNLFLKQAIILFLLAFLSFGNIVAQKPAAVLDSCIKRLSEIKSGELEVRTSFKNSPRDDFPVEIPMGLELKDRITFYSTKDSSGYIQISLIETNVCKDTLVISYKLASKEYFLKENSLTHYRNPYNLWVSNGEVLKEYIDSKYYFIKYVKREKVGDVKYYKFETGYVDLDEYTYIYIHPTTYLPEITIEDNGVLISKHIVKPNQLYKEVNSAIYEEINKKYNQYNEAYLQQPEEVRTATYDPWAYLKDTTTISVAPLWSLPTLEDDTFHFENVTSKLVLLDFWFVNCKPCLSAIKTLVKLDSVYSDIDLQIIGLNVVDTSISKMQQIVDTYHIEYPVVHQAGNTAEEYAVSAYPTLFLIDTQSKKVLYKHRGYTVEMQEELEKAIEKALKGEN